MAYNKSYKEQLKTDYENLTGEKPPKTLVSGIRRKSERDCNCLRTYGEPTEVKVFKATPDWSHKFDIGEPIRIDPLPVIDTKPNFNNRKR